MKTINRFLALTLCASLLSTQAGTAVAAVIAVRGNVGVPVAPSGMRIGTPAASAALGGPAPLIQTPAAGVLPGFSQNPATAAGARVPAPLAATPAQTAASAPIAPAAAPIPAESIPSRGRTPGALGALKEGGRALTGASGDHVRVAASLRSLYSGTPAPAAAGVEDAVPAEPGERTDSMRLRPSAVSEKSFGNSAPPISPEASPELYRPKSSREGIGPVKYVRWNTIYAVMQWLNLKFARDPNRKVSWDKWPKYLGLLYLLAKIRYLRSDTLTDPYDYAANDTKKAQKMPKTAKIGYPADGTWAADNENPQMGATDTRYGSNIPPKKIRPDVENMTPSAREAGKLKWRHVKETGKAVLQPALILNDLAGGWIQFMFHNFGGNTKRDPVEKNPHRMPRDGDASWPKGEPALVDRTTTDPSRVTDNGRPTPVSERLHHWIHAQIYATSDAELAELRAFENGRMKLAEDGRLPEDPKKPGIDKTGFSNNYTPQLSFLHWIFTMEHNAIADHYRYFHPEWDDETLFQMARKANVAQMARIHTVEWTMDLLQHPTLQLGMHADWYGLVGQKLKLYVMRLSYRHPWIGRALKFLTDDDTLWGMPGSRWEHHDGPFQVPKQFRMVYRLHEMILDEHELMEPGTDRTLDRIELLKFVHGNTRAVVEKFGYDVLGYSFVRKSAGALKLHNFPRALSQFHNQQNGKLTDLAELDIFRERTDGTGTYNEFRESLGEPPVSSFLELTGGDAELAKEIERVYEGDINKVDAGIGILAEPKPDGFALSFTQFYQFVLNAPRRVKSNRHLTEYFTYKDYGEGMDWVEHGGGMLGAMARHLGGMKYGKDVLAAMEGVVRPFAPWPDAETHPRRLMAKTEAANGAIVKTNLLTLALGAAAAVVAAYTGALAFSSAVELTLLLAVPATLFFKRMLAWRFFQKAWQSAYTDKRASLFATLYKGELWNNRAASRGKLAALAVLGGAGWLAAALWAASPAAAGIFALTALSALPTLSAIEGHRKDMQLLKISLQNRMRSGIPWTDPKDLPGKTALEKRYWFLADGGKPVATFSSTYAKLKEAGLPPFKAFMTAALSHLSFGGKTQKGISWKEKGEKGIARWRWFFNDIYLPNLHKAYSDSASRVFAREGNARGIAPGDVDMEEFERMMRSYAPGRDYMTAYDLARMREGNRVRDAREGRGSVLSRFLGRLAAKRRADQLMALYADHAAMEDNHLVPAISRDMLLRVYQGSAQYDLMKERAGGSLHHALARPKPLKGED